MKVFATDTRKPAPRRGAAAVEFAVVAVVFLMFFFGILEVSRILFVRCMMDNAAREGARFAVVTSSYSSTSQIQTYTDNYLVGMGAGNLVGYTATNNVSVFRIDPTTGNQPDWYNAQAGDPVGVTISGTYRPITPVLLFLPSNITLTTSAILNCEAVQ
jgi:Flp pilus assembly protein TadG